MCIRDRSKELARILGITVRRVNQLADEGEVFQREVSGNFDCVECVAAYYNNKFTDEDYKEQYNKERALHEKAKREKAEIELSEMKAEVHKAEDIEFFMTDMLTTFRNRMLSIPSKLAPQLTGVNNTNLISSMLRSEIMQALEELSEYDPEEISGTKPPEEEIRKKEEELEEIKNQEE